MDNLERPDGSVATAVGWLLIVAGILGIVGSMAAETTGGMLAGFGLANLGIGLGVLLLSLGYLVRAIWFLPGREISIIEVEGESAGAMPQSPCDWCGRKLGAGFRTCTSLNHESLERVSMKVRDPLCQEQLRERGYAIAASPD